MVDILYVYQRIPYVRGEDLDKNQTEAVLKMIYRNGKEFDRMHGLDWYDYGARMYAPVIGRWTVVDPFAEKYYDVSPYTYCGNNPVNAIDEEGKKILFVNGYYNSLFKSLNMGPSRGSEEYWSTNFYINAQRFFNDYSAYDRRNFIDACSNPFSSGTDRFKLGREYAEKHYKDIVSNLGGYGLS